MGSGSDALVAESVSEIAGSMGEEKVELSINALLRLRYHMLEKV
jgi:hypothetical protein